MAYGAGLEVTGNKAGDKLTSGAAHLVSSNLTLSASLPINLLTPMHD